MLISKIKQNLAGFAAVVVASAAFTAIAPATAAGTSVTTPEVSYLSVTRTNNSVSSSSLTATATVGSDERMQNIYSYANLAENANQVAIQAGDQLKVTGTYTNLTDNSTVSYLSSSCSDWSSLPAGSSTWSYGNSCAMTSSQTNTISKTVGIGLSAGNYSGLRMNMSFNLGDASMSAGDQIRFVISYSLVRSGSDIPLTIRTSQGSDNSASFYFAKTNATASHTVNATDSNLNLNSDFCVYRGENGVTDNTQITVNVSNSGTGNVVSYLNGDGTVYGSMSSITRSTSGNTITFTMPSSGWSVARLSAWASVDSGSLTVGQTFTPVLSAVIAGTSTSVIDKCSRAVTAPAAPTVTAGSTSVTVAWGALPTIPVGGTWDTIRVLACETTLATCGQYTPSLGMYNPSAVIVQSYTLRSNGMISSNATSYTAASNNMMFMPTGPNQPSTSWSANTSYKYFVAFEDMDSPYYAVSALSTAIATSSAQQQVQNNNVQQQVAPSLPTNVPLVAPISVPQAGFKPGGALVLDGRNMAAVTSIKIGSTATTTVKTASGIEVKVPTDLAPGAHDLLVTTATGSTLFVGAVKVADPAVVAAKEAVAKAAASILYRAPIDLTVGKTVSSAQAAAAKNFASQYRNAKSAVCIAIPASKATLAAAIAAATQLCATFKYKIPGIKTTVTFTAPSGDKVNRVSAEVQG